MKILIIGSGGREHALAWRLAQSPSVTEVFTAPGNPGAAQVSTCVPLPREVGDIAQLAEHLGVDLTVVGPEAPLVAGVVDAFRARGLDIVGPTRAASRLEGSKIFAKQFFERAGIPTARSLQVSNEADARSALQSFSPPIVIKADGLAAGKGVVIAPSQQEAQRAIGLLGPALVIEEFLSGEEISFIALSDGERVYPFAPSQDHKRVFDNDSGPNTGGMGAVSDPALLSSFETGEILDRIMLPAVRQMQREGTPFTGFLYAGLMMTPEGPKILEFNVRMGDPETQAILHGFQGDLAEFLASPQTAGAVPSRPAACVVMAAEDYPNAPKLGDPILGVHDTEASGATVFQAGTRLEGANLVTAGGRVLGITASARDLSSAIEAAYRGVDQVSFRGTHFRRDIGSKALLRCYTARKAGT